MGFPQLGAIAAISIWSFLPSCCFQATPATASARRANPTHAAAHTTNQVVHAQATNQPAMLPATNRLASAPVTNNVLAVRANVKDLGELQLTNHCEIWVSLDGGLSCSIQGDALEGDQIRITMAVCSSKTNGNMAGLNITRATAKRGQIFEMPAGNWDICFKPVLVKD